MSQADIHRLNLRVLAGLGDGLDDYIRQAARRFVRETFMQASPAYWLRRAETFEALGTAEADLIAMNCRQHAWLLAQSDAEVPEDLAAWVEAI